jgi:hypothetical protein
MFDEKLHLFWVLLSILIGILFLQTMLHYTGGHLSVPNSDYFVFFQYAKQLVAGHPFEFNTGDPRTNGATSFLYTVILAPGYIFFKGIRLYLFAFLLAILLLICSVYLYFSIARHFFGRFIAFFSSLLFLLSGPIAFNYFAGMDFALYSFLFLAALYVFCSSLRRRCLILAVLLSLLIYTRPEGAVLFLLFFLVEMLCCPKETGFGQKLWLLVIPGISIVSLILLNYKITGGFGYPSLSGRSVFANYSFFGGLTRSFFFIVNSIKGILVGTLLVGKGVGQKHAGLEGAFFAPFMFFFFIIGICTTLKGKVNRAQIGLGSIIGFTVIIAILIGSVSVFSGVSHHRYAAWTYPGIILLAVVGLDRFSQLFGQIGRSIKFGFLTLWVVFSVLSLWLFMSYFGKVGYRFYFQDILLSKWMGKNLPPQARVISLHAALYKYLTNRYIIDVGGTGFRGFTGSTPKNINNRLLKYLQYSNEPPQYQVITSGAPSILKELARPEDLLTKTNSYLPDEARLYRLNLEGIKQGLFPLSPAVVENTEQLSLVDAVDIGYLPSEQQHKYSVWAATPETWFTLPTLKARIDEQQVWDAGRLITKKEFFEIQVIPGRELLWVARIKSSLKTALFKGEAVSPYPFSTPSIELKLTVNDKPVAKLMFPAEKPDRWQEIFYLIPGKYLTTPKAQISIHGRYGSFHHWFYQ